MTLDENETKAALDHLDQVTAMLEALMPVLRVVPQAEPNLVQGLENVSRSARGWLNQQRVRESMESLRASQGASDKPSPQPRTEEAKAAPPPAPEQIVNPLEFLGDLLKTLSPVADVLGKLGGLPRR